MDIEDVTENMDLFATAEQMQQKREIATIKPRNFSIDLSDADCHRIIERCAECGITVGDLISNFIGDLICGTCPNGSDEREYANQWFNRCWFAHREKTLLCHLLDYGYDPSEYLDATAAGSEDQKKYVAEMKSGFRSARDIDTETEIISRWVAERKAILG